MEYSMIVSAGLGLISAGLFFAAFRHFSQAERRLGFDNRCAPGLVAQTARSATEAEISARKASRL